MTDAPTVPGNLTAADRARLRQLKWRLDWHLEARVPRRRRNEITEEIRANVVAASADHGVRGAIERLGPLREVAAAYAAAERTRVHRRAGIVAGLSVVLGLYMLSLVIGVAFHEGAAAVDGGARGGETSWAYSWEIADGFGPFAGSYDAESGVFAVMALAPSHLLAGLIAFALGARVWRWRPQRSASTGPRTGAP